MKNLKIFITAFFLTLSMYSFSQKIEIDGNLTELHWIQAIQFTEFKTFKPTIGINASQKTEVFVTSDSLHLYIGVKAYDSEPSKIMANLTNRDNLSNDDVFTVEIDVNGSGNSNIFFRVNPLGIQEDGVITQAEEEDLNPDKVWFSKGMITDFGYQVEIAIPFQSLRFKWKPEVEINMGFMRKIFRKSELVVFPEYDSNISNRLMQRETLSFSNIKRQRVLELIPSVTYTYDNVLTNGEWNTEQNRIDLGITGKIGITSDLVVDLTYNPDFSQIESDAGKIDINLRNPLYFPEKRPFFQEGVELFNFGGQGMYHMPLEYMVHTRNIIDPIYGVKLTGNLGENYSIATILSTDESSGDYDHYQIFRLQRKLNNDNFIGILYTGKETPLSYNRIGGLDGKIRLNGKNSIEYNFFRSYSYNNELSKAGNNFGAHYNFKDHISNLSIGYYQNDENFNTEVGYLTRKGLHNFPVAYNMNLPLKSEKINKFAIWLNARPKIDMVSDKFEYWSYAGFELYLKNDSWFWMGKSFAEEIYLNRTFDAGYIGGGYFIQLNKYFYWQGYVGWENKIYYDELNPYQGYGLSTNQTLLFTPTNQLKIKLSGAFENFYRTSNKEFVYDYTLTRIHTTYQLNKSLFVRAIGEYNFYKDQLSSELLISFTYIPGTVLQLGYNLNAQKNLMDKNMMPVENLQVNKNLLFFKASYLFHR